MSRIRQYRPSPAMVVAAIALFFALGGVSYGLAAGSVDTREIKNNTIRTQDVKNNALRSKDIRNRAILGRDVHSETITSRQIRNPEGFHDIGTTGEPPFQSAANNFGNGFSTAAFYRDNEGTVHLKGTIRAGDGTVVFTLPPRYRPDQVLNIGVNAGGSPGFVYIRPNGQVEVHGPTGQSSYGLDGISFRAER